MSGNQLRRRLAGGEASFGGWCTIPSSFSAELVAASGCDYVAVDMQHGLAGFSDLVAMVQAISLQKSTPIVRIPVGDFATAQRALDAGAEGIIVPYVGTREEALEAVAACRYPPLGRRSFGPIRSRLHLGSDSDRANEEILCIVMIETTEALENLDEILAIPGVDAAYVGPADLALNLGSSRGSGVYDPANDPVAGQGDGPSNSTQPLDRAISRILSACKAEGKPVGIHTRSGIDAADAIRRGFAFATVTTDAVLLAGAYGAEMEAARSRHGATLVESSPHTP